MHPTSHTNTYTLLFPANLKCGSLKPLSFISASSSTASVLGPSCKAVSQLLLAIYTSLNQEFHTNLDPKLNLPRDLSLLESGSKEPHFATIAGSQMKETAPHLRAMGAKVTDLSIPGWVSNTANGQQLMDRVRSAELPPDVVYLLDFLGNSSVHFKLADESSLLPVKLNGHWHFLSYFEVMGSSYVESPLFSVSHLYKQNIRSCGKIFLPPIPRKVFGSCHYDLGHGANARMPGHGGKMLSEHCRVGQNLKGTLVGERVMNMRVLDVLGCLTHTNNTTEQLTALKHIIVKDNMNLTELAPADFR
jgi:hypothetical protein